MAGPIVAANQRTAAAAAVQVIVLTIPVKTMRPVPGRMISPFAPNGASESWQDYAAHPRKVNFMKIKDPGSLAHAGARVCVHLPDQFRIVDHEVNAQEPKDQCQNKKKEPDFAIRLKVTGRDRYFFVKSLACRREKNSSGHNCTYSAGNKHNCQSQCKHFKGPRLTTNGGSMALR